MLNRKRTHWSTRMIAAVLALIMMLGNVPASVFATEITGEEVVETTVPETTAPAGNETGETKENPWNGRSAVFVGDSITAGSGTTKIYYQFLKETLGFGSVTAMGVAGSCISAASDYGQGNQPLINRYQNIPSADLIVIFMGTNDYGHETPLGSESDTQDGTFYGALNVVIPALVAKHTASKIVFVTPLHRYGFGTSKILGTQFTYDNIPNGVGATLGDYVEALKTVCANNGVSVIDLHTECTLDPADSEVRESYMPDGLHPNAAGHELIAGIMESHIRELEPAEKTPEETEPEEETELVYGNKFASGFTQQNRASSRINQYLSAGTVITLKDPDVFQWACAKTNSENSSNNLGYFPDGSWSDKETAVVETDGWVGFVFKYRDETEVFDLTKPLSDYITIEVPHTHSYESTVTAPTCSEQGYTTHTCACGDKYVDSYVDAAGHSYENGVCTVCGTEIGEPVWEQGTIASADGTNNNSPSRFRTADYHRLSDYSGVGIRTGYTMTNFVYDKDYNYLGTSSWLGSGMPFTTAQLQEKYPTGVYFRVVFRADDQHNLTEADVAASGVKFYLPGEEVPTPDFGYSYENVGSIGSWQDGAIWDGKLFALGAAGTGAVFDVQTGARLGSLKLDGADVLKPHANSVCFGSTYYAAGDDYPLLYVNIYNNYVSAADRLEGTCCVYRVTETDGVFTTDLVQVIKIGFTEDLNLWKSKENNGDVRPYGNFVVDTDNHKLYAFVMRDANKTTRFFEFDIPGLDEGTYNESYGCNVVTLETGDIKTQFNSEHYKYLQGCCYSSGKILYMGDFGGDAPLCVVDLESQKVTDVFCLGYAGLTAESEVLCVDPADGTLYYAAADGILRIIKLDDVHFHGYTSVITAPTCTEQGYTTHTCTICGDKYVDSYVDAAGHSYVNGVCAVCGDTFAGKTVSILSHSMSTYAGVSNNTAYNSTIGKNDVYYTEGRHGVYRKDTWWQQAIDALGMELLVNNSWSGSCVFQPRKGAASVGYGDRAVNLHNDHTGEEPDIIWVYLGCNDFAYYQDTFGKAADVDYSALIKDNGDGTFTYAVPQTACEAYAIMLHKVQNRYPDAEIYCMTSTARREVDYAGDSYPDAGQPTEYVAQLQKIATHFGYPVVDLEKAIPKEVELFDKYMGDKRAHANALGMDQITQALVRTMLGKEVTLFDVSGEYHAVDTDNEAAAAVSGMSYTANLTAQTGYTNLDVTVTMGGVDVTEAVYSGGTIHIEAVTGDLVIHAAGAREPMNFRWELEGSDLVSTGKTANAVTKLAGTVTDGVLDGARYQMENAAVLQADHPWVLEWKCAGDWRGIFLSSAPAKQTTGMYYISRTKGGQLCFGSWTGTQHNNYGIDLSNLDAQTHTYRLVNRIAADGSNMIWLYVDGTEIGPMNNYYVGSNSQNATSDWVSGKNFEFAYIGVEGTPLNTCALDYLEVWENGKPSFEGKTVSILGDSISTYAGISNNTSYNSTIGKNAIYYNTGALDGYENTWWQQAIDALGMELLVNNSWSGSCILHTRSSTVGAYVDRCVQLHNDHTGEEPDVIAVFMGTNDFSYYQSALGTADFDYDTLIKENADGSFTYATPTTSCEAYAIMLHKMTNRYPNAEIYCMTMMARREPVYSGADVGQPTAFNAELAKIIAHFGCTMVDLQNCGITKDPANFDLYMGDKRVHPNAAGMDKMTEALVGTMLGRDVTLYSVSGNYTGVVSDQTAATLISGGSYTAKLSPETGFFDLQVTVTMGGSDVTASVYADGVITIPSVTGDVVIDAKASRKPVDFRWEVNENALVSVTDNGNTANNPVLKGGSIANGMMSNAYWKLTRDVVLRHNLPWVVEFRVSGNWSGMVLSEKASAGTEGNVYLFKTTGTNGFMGFGERIGSNYHNYGIALGAQGVDTTLAHTYRLENRIADDGTNMVYLLVDGVDYGAMNHYFIGGSTNQGKTVDWLNGRDLIFSHIGASGHAMNNCAIDYIQVWENGQPSLAGKTISILGASISTFEGTSNGAAADTTNSTIRGNVKYYPNTTIPEVTLNDTWWMQAANDLDLRLLVNNSWSGSSLLHERNGTVGAYVDRCVQLHDDTGDNAGEIPDIIAIQMGTNDFQYYKDTLGTADIDYAALIKKNADGTFTYATPVTSLEAAAIVLHKISVRYPDAEVYYLNISQRVDGTDELIRSFNAELKQVVEHFGAHIVDIYGSAITMEDFSTYIGDGRVHPNKLGMDAYTEAFKRALIANTSYSVDTHTVSLELDGVTANYGDDKIVVSGDSFAVDLAASDDLNVTVTMGGTDITEYSYANGTVTIDAVTADVTITAKSVRIPANYRWEFDGTDLVSVGETENKLTRNAGTTTDGVFSNTRYALEKAVVLNHDEPWVVQWKSEGTFKNTGSSTGARIFTSTDVNAEYNARYIFKSATKWIIAMGEKDTKGSHNYGIALADHGIDGSEPHTYRLENRIADDGSNMIWLYVDGAEIGPMNNYYIGTTSQKTTSDWLSGKDFLFPYMGTDTHGFTNASIEYVQVFESHTHSYTSIVTAPTCTQQGFTTHTCAACGDEYVDSYVDATGHSWAGGVCGVCGATKKPYQRLTYFTVDVQTSDGKSYTDNAVLYLPKSYSPNGEPVKLVIYCKQGASQITASSNPIEAVGFYNYLISLGYAVLGVDGVPDAWRDELGLGERAVGNPMAVQGTERAYNYVIDNYNIAADGCFISGYSQGGHYAQNVIDLTDIPILAAAEQSPVCSMRYHQWDLNASQTVGGVTFTKAARLNVARIYGFPAVASNAELLNLAYDASLVAEYDPWVRNSQNVYTGFVQKSNLWYLPDGTSLDDITMTHTVKCPVKIWCAEDDTAISADVMKVFVKAIQNAGGTAEISVAESGGHGFFQNQTAVGTFTENGKTYKTLPIAVEIAQWFARFGGYECGHDYSSEVTAPTCTEQGYTTLVCKVCGDTKLETRTMDLTEAFVWTDGKMILATTGACTDYATWQASDYVDISAFDSIVIKTANTISVNTTTGLAFYDADRNYISGIKHTDGVGKEYGTLIHTLEVPENAVYIRSTWYGASHPNYSSAFGEFSCTATGQYVPATGHSYESVVTPPTCTAQGTIVYTCSDCGDSYTETVNRAEHAYDDGVCTVCGVSILGSDWITPDLAQGDYTMVVLPDTQILVQYWPEIYYNQMQWIADNKDTLNIQAVLHMGDMVNNNNATEWTVCEAGTDILGAAGIPWMPMRGNHDDSAWFNRYYDYASYGTNQSWFGGSYHADKLDHTYWFVTVGEREYMILSLGWAPSCDVLTWAQGIVEENADKSVILACHAYMNKDGTLLGTGDAHCVTSFLPGYPNGDDVWAAFKDYGNVVLAMGGHIHSPDIVTYVDQNGAGRDVTSLLFDRQDDDTKNRYAMIALLTFHADSENVDINWYSTRYDALFRAKNQFSITVPGVCEHNYTSAIVKPTCTEDGGTKYTCDLCGHSYWENPEGALGHSFENDICGICGLIRIDMTGLFTDWTAGGPVLFRNGYGYGEKGFPDGPNPNLKYSGYISVEGIDTLELTVCARKGNSATGGYAFYTDKGVEYFISEGSSTRNGNGAAAEGTVVHTIAIPEGAKYIRVTYWVDSTSYAAAVPFSCVGYTDHVHTYTPEVTAPTCTEQGYTTHTCACGDTYVDTYVDALDHSFKNYVSNDDASCTADGTKTAKCERCDETDTIRDVGTAKGHAFDKWIETKAPTCTEKGEERRDCANCDHFETREVEATGHDYDAVVTAPTCEDKGYTTHTCSVCGDSYVDSYVNAIGHKFGDWTIIDEPTCTEKGMEQKNCDNCDHFETREVDATGHDYEAVVTKPTCEDKGFTTHTCPKCGDSYVDNYVDAIGHEFGEWTVTTAPTCTEKGEERRECANCDHFETREVDATGHDYETVVTKPTCEDKGYTTHTCSKCGDSYVDNYVDATGHKFGDWTVTIAPTCTEKGEERRECANCDHFETREVDATGHDYETVVTKPTCEDKGYTTHTCSKCGDSYVDSYVNAIGHKFGEWTVTIAPTCTEKGEERRGCDNCDHFEIREVEATGHDYEAVVTKPTCEDKGYTTHTCSKCGNSYVDSYVNALGHEYGEWYVTKEATLEEEGEERRDCGRCDDFQTRKIPMLVHNYTSVVTEPTCTEQGYTTHICQNCGDTYVDTHVTALGHSFKNYVSNDDASCTADGTKTAKCERCDETDTIRDAGTAKGHKFGEWTVTTEPTCTEKGEECRDCDNCDHFETREVDATGHDYETVVTKPTCEEKGYTAHTCSKCDDSYVDNYVDATGHKFGDWTVTIAPTCTEKGEERRDCENCDHYETREVNATGHNYKAVVTKPTCEEKGYTTHTCSKCDDSYIDNYVDATGHKFGDWTIIDEPTCTEKGMEQRDCDNCDHIEIREVDAIGHDYKAVVTKPTCEEKGYTTHTCSVCGDSYVDSYVDALGHDFENGTCTNCGEPEVKYLRGDVDLDGDVDVDDVLALLWYVLFPDDYPIGVDADFDRNENTDVDDVLALLWYVLFPEDYPIV